MTPKKINLSAMVHKDELEPKADSTKTLEIETKIDKNITNELPVETNELLENKEKVEEIPSLVAKISLSSIKKDHPSYKAKEDINLTPQNNSSQEIENNEKVQEDIKPIIENKLDQEVENTTTLLSNISNKEIENTKKVEEKVSLIPRISLSSIKKSKSPDEVIEEEEIKEENEHEMKKEELLETMLGTESDITTPIENLKIDGKITGSNNLHEEVKEKSIDSNNSENDTSAELAEIEKKINEKVEEEVNKKIKKGTIPLTNGEIIDNDAELFGNYKSEFTKKEDIIIEKVVLEKKKFRERLKEPKTRILLILLLLLIPIITVSALFIIDPENNSVDKYRETVNNNITKFKEKYINKEWVLNKTIIENHSFDTFSQKNIFGTTSYKYNNIIYTNKEGLDKILNRELYLIKKENEKIQIEKDRINSEKLNANTSTGTNNINTSTGTKINTSTGTKINTSTGTKINTSTGTKINTSTGTKINTSTGTKINTSTGTKINTSTGTSTTTTTNTINTNAEKLRLEEFNKIKNILHSKYR